MTVSTKTILYTGKGDDGYTGLLGKKRVPKYDLRPEAYGTVDEASAFMGLVRVEPTTNELTKNLILKAQRDLSTLMCELATSSNISPPQSLIVERVAWLETEINRLNSKFPPLNQFIVPGDNPVSTRLDVARTVVRRAERRVVKLVHEEQLTNKIWVSYLNRLSALLFALARYEDYLTGTKSRLVKDIK